MIDEQTGQRRQAYADELTQPQEMFLFYACEERRRKRNDTDGNDTGGTGAESNMPAGTNSTTHHIG